MGMSIDKAIEVQEKHNDKANALLYPELTEASKLGIEALKFKHEWDMGRIFPNNYLLPGETQDH